MIAKLVTHAPSRAAAIEAQSRALDAFYIDGIRHNMPFLSALMQHPRWKEGGSPPASSPRNFRTALRRAPPEGEVARRIAAVAAAIDHVIGERKRQISGQLNGRPVTRERRRAVWLDRNEIALDVAREDEGIAVRFVDADGQLGNPHNAGLDLDAGRSGLAGHHRRPCAGRAGAPDRRTASASRIRASRLRSTSSPRSRRRPRG